VVKVQVGPQAQHHLHHCIELSSLEGALTQGH
jgi:hypothetical protein